MARLLFLLFVFDTSKNWLQSYEKKSIFANFCEEFLFFRPKCTMLWTKNMNGWMKRETRNENIRLQKRLTAEGVIRKDGVGRATFYVRNSSSGE
jgi:hypothetical protein